MIAIDSSAVIAILLSEPSYRELSEAIAKHRIRLMPAVNFVESSLVINSKLPIHGLKELNNFIETLGISVEEVCYKQAKLAVEAFLRYGKGKHPAALNMGDCFAYALAKDYDIPLLFKGEDFSKTDIKPAV